MHPDDSRNILSPSHLPLARADVQALCIKAAILPYLPAATIENWRICVMKPVAAHPERGPAPFQLAKGTRMRRAGEGWVDMNEGERAGADDETLPQTALREGEEELGLMAGEILRLADAGEVSFTSVKTGAAKTMWLFAAEMRGEDCLLPMASVAPTTAERAWMTLLQFRALGRADHVSAVEAAFRKLA